jgi:hypothetical protein
MGKETYMMHYDYIIVGAGYSGLEQAKRLKEQNVESVLLIEFEDQVGGRPWDPSVDVTAPYETLTNSKVINISESTNGFLVVYQNSRGQHTLEAERVIVASGSVERERFFDFITGDRPSGDIVPKLGLNLLKRGFIPGFKPLIVNSNEYAQELIEKLEKIDQVEVIEINPELYEILQVEGQSRVESVLVKDKATDTESMIACDALVYANGILPMSHSVLEMAIDLDKDNFILTNEQGKSSIAGLYAFGDVAK